jgi:hypothetical protein
MTARPRGPQRDWQPRSPRQQGILADLIARYRQHEQEGTLPRGGRGIFYDLRPNGMGNGVTYRKPDSAHPLSGFGPMEAHPAAVQEVLVMARRAGIIKEAWVADTRAPAPITPGPYDDAADDVAATIAYWAENAVTGFDMDPQRGQPQYVELLCEAEDLAPRLARVATPYGVPVYSGGGFDGLKGKRVTADRAALRNVPTIILHIGDRDPHGEMIFAAVSEDVAAWAADAGIGPDWLEFRRLAVTEEQAEQYDLLDADGKAEADSLPVQVLDAIVTGALDGLRDRVAYAALRAEEERQKGLLPAAIRSALAPLLGGDDDE